MLISPVEANNPNKGEHIYIIGLKTMKIKNVQISFTELELDAIKEVKKDMTWHDWILHCAEELRFK